MIHVFDICCVKYTLNTFLGGLEPAYIGGDPHLMGRGKDQQTHL